MSAVADRETLRERATELRAQGLGPTAIGRELGVAKTTVVAWTHPSYAARQRRLSREAKRRRTGTCIECGATTRYGGHETPGGISRYCADCGPAVGGQLTRERRLGKGPMQARVLAFCMTPRRFSEIRDELGTTEGHVAQLLHRLVRYGLLTRVARGVYVTTSPLESRPREGEAASTRVFGHGDAA